MQFLEEILKDPNYRHFTAAYDENKLELIMSSKDFIFTPLNKKYGVVSCTTDFDYGKIVERTVGIVDFIERSLIYTPQYIESKYEDIKSIDPMIDSKIETIKSLESLKLDGDGVLVGILDTGINYFSRERILEECTRSNYPSI